MEHLKIWYNDKVVGWLETNFQAQTSDQTTIQFDKAFLDNDAPCTKGMLWCQTDGFELRMGNITLTDCFIMGYQSHQVNANETEKTATHFFQNGKVSGMLKKPEPKSRDKFIIVMEALLEGLPLKIGDTTYHWDTGLGLVHECKLYRNGTDKPPEITYMPSDMDLIGFYLQCQTLTFDETFLIGASKTLTTMGSRNY